MTDMRKIVVILDINAIPRAKKIETSPDGSKEEREEIDKFDKEAVDAVKQSVFMLLCREAKKLDKSGDPRNFDFSRIEWTFKLFNSSVELHSKSGKKFAPLNNATVESFEASLDAAVQADSVSSLKSNPEANNIKLFSTTLMSVLSDLRWIESQTSDDGVSGNSIYAFIRVPRNARDFDVFTSGCSVVFQAREVLNELIPRAFLKKMKEDRIQLNMVDMWNLHGHKHELDPGDGIAEIKYDKSIKKIVQALGQGAILPFSYKRDKLFGDFPSFCDLLKLIMDLQSTNMKPCADGNKNMNSSIDSKLNTSGNQVSLNISPPEFDSSSRQGSSSFRLEAARSRSNPNKFRESCLDVVPYDSKVAVEGKIRKRKQIQRHSDEFLLYAKESSRKRKMFQDDFEDEEKYVRIPSGYSKRDINSWYDSNNTNPSPEEIRRRMKKYRSEKRKSVGSVSKHAIVHEQARIRDRRYATEEAPRMSKYSPTFCDASVMRKYKRSKRHEDELMMAPPSRRKSIKQQRHSAPNSFPEPKLSTSYAGSIASSSLASRGRMMLAEGMKKALLPKDGGFENLEQLIHDEKSLEQQYDMKLKKRQNEFNSLKTRFELKLSEIQVTDVVGEELLDMLDDKVSRFREVCIDSGTDLVCLAQVLVSLLTKSFGEWKVQDTEGALEEILLTSVQDLNLSLLRNMGGEGEEDVFGQIELQVLLHMEIALSLSEESMNTKNQRLLSDTISLLNMIKMYRRKPPVEEFVTEILLPEFKKTLPRFVREIMFALNIHPPEEIMESPGRKDADFRDDCSVSSATSSIMSSVSVRYERDNARRLSQESVSQSFYNASQDSQSRALKKGFSFIQANNPQRAIMISSSKPKNDKTKLDLSRASGSRSTVLLRQSPKPKKVRRNLFDVSANDSKDIKHLVSLATNSNSFTRSPSLFKSPSLSSKKSGCSPRSPARVSPYFKAARNLRIKRCLNLESESNNSNLCEQSPRISEILVPESPVTPQSKGKMSNPGSEATSGNSVVQESPEIDKSGEYENNHSLSRRVNTVSFYSSGADSSKAKSWEISGNKLTAARIKDSVDTSMGLNLSDLEMLPRGFSPSSNLTFKFHHRRGTEADSSTDIFENEAVTLSYNHRPEASPVASSSKAIMWTDCRSSNTAHGEIVNARPGELQSTNIEALINCENFPPASVILNAGNTSMPLAVSPAKNMPLMDTPSKKVVFNLHENLINTPSPKNPITGTPKSILKDCSGTGMPDPSPETTTN